MSAARRPQNFPKMKVRGKHRKVRIRYWDSEFGLLATTWGPAQRRNKLINSPALLLRALNVHRLGELP